jgi:hypothetical protein
MRNIIIISIIVVILSFAYFFFGVQDENVAVVNGVPISSSLYEKRVSRVLAGIESSGENIDDFDIKELRENILTDSIHEELFIQEANKLGLTANSNELCQEAIATYGQENVENSLASQKMTMEDFCWENYRQHLLRMVIEEKDMEYEEILDILKEKADIVIK